MRKKIQFGENVEGYNILVLNEREIRATAGIMFLGTSISFIFILFGGNFVPIKYLLTIFLLDFSIRIFISPLFSPLLLIGRFIVQNQTPEFVGAEQKKFAWYIGLVLSTIMFILIVIMNTYSPITFIVCAICLILMFFETSFGICIGCLIYRVIKKEKAQYCPGEICDVKSKQETKKYSKYLIVIFILIIVSLGLLFSNKLREKPHNLFMKSNSSQVN